MLEADQCSKSTARASTMRPTSPQNSPMPADLVRLDGGLILEPVAGTVSPKASNVG